jgi:O-antigen ligase
VSALLALPMLYVLILSFRRGAWVGFAFALFVTLLARSRDNIRIPVLKLAIIAVLVLASVLWFMGSSSMELVTSRLVSISDIQEDPSNAFRILDALNALNTFAKHPVFGVGFGGRYDMKYYSEALAPPIFWDSVSHTSHDGYLFILYKTGVIGFSIYAVMLVAFFLSWWKGRRIIRDPYAGALFLAFGAASAGILVTNLTSPITDSLRPALMLSFLMSFAAIIYEHARQTQRAELPSQHS